MEEKHVLFIDIALISNKSDTSDTRIFLIKQVHFYNDDDYCI